jgi:acetyltransferase-like isoleucine patch superfamily enzyme
MVPIEQRHLVRGKVVIGKDAFLAQYSIIMPGVTIGDGAVVGPHSLVVRDVAPWTIVLGSPARTIGRREPVRFPDP